MYTPPPVRPARSADAERLRELQTHLPEPSPALLSAALDELSTTVEPLAPTARTWRLRVSPNSNDEPVGYLLAFDSRGTHIAEVVVEPAFRRQNRAKLLLTSVCGSTSQPVTVCVAAENRPARSLYEQCGFVESTRTPEQFESGEGITMRYEPASTQ